VEDDPQARLALARRFYTETPNRRKHNWGTSLLGFMDWELRRGVLNPIDGTPPGSPWWRAVNGRLLLDAQEAFLLHEEGHDRSANPGVNAWLGFLDDQTSVNWYRAHNTSICLGYVASSQLARHESGHEQKLTNLILARALFTQAVVDGQPWSFGLLTPVLARSFDPEGKMVGVVVRDSRLYPMSYPLSEADCHRLDRRPHHPGELLPSIVDQLFIRSRLERLFEYIAGDLGLPDVEQLQWNGSACYPWALHLHGNERDGMRLSDRPGVVVRMLSHLVNLGR